MAAQKFRLISRIIFYAIIAVIIGVVIYRGQGGMVASVAVITAVIAAVYLALRWLGKLISRRVKIKKWQSRLCSVLLAVTVIFMTFCGVILAIQDGMIFYPVYDYEARERLLNLPNYQEIIFTANNGKSYHGMIRYACEEPAPLIIYFGGNAENSYGHMYHREVFGEWEALEGFHYLYMDYEGYGRNSGRPNYRNMYEMSLIAYDYAAALPNVDSENIVAMGFSLGTGSATYLAANREITGLILIAPYASGYDLYNSLLPIFHGPMRILVRQRLTSDRFAPDVICPVLVIASRDDGAIPFDSSENLAGLFPDVREFVILDDFCHNSMFFEEITQDKIREFLEAKKD
jgi:hypothetical protein